MDCYYYKPAYDFVPEEPPPEQETIVSKSWGDGEMFPAHEVKRGPNRFPPDEFECLSQRLLHREEEELAIFYAVYKRRGGGSLYVQQHRKRGLAEAADVIDTFFRVDDIDAILHMVCSDSGGPSNER